VINTISSRQFASISSHTHSALLSMWSNQCFNATPACDTQMCYCHVHIPCDW